MKTTASLVKLIVFMVVTSLLTFVLAATIGNFSFGAKTNYKAAFNDVTGLLPGNEVRIAGVRVGKVNSLELKGKVALVGFSLDEGRKISDTSLVRLRYRNLVGERYLSITAEPGTGTPLPDGASIPMQRTRDALDLTVLFNGFRPLFQALDPGTVNQVAFEIIQTLQGEGGTVESLLARKASLTNTLADRDKVIGRVIDNLTTVLATFDDREMQVNELVTQLQRLSAGFAQDRVAIGASLDGIDDLTTATSGLLKQARSPLKSDIGQLMGLAATLDDEKDVVGSTINRLPTKLDRIVSTATDGSWFNFYLCGADITGLDKLGLPLTGVTGGDLKLVNPAARCQTGGDQ